MLRSLVGRGEIQDGVMTRRRECEELRFRCDGPYFEEGKESRWKCRRVQLGVVGNPCVSGKESR